MSVGHVRFKLGRSFTDSEKSNCAELIGVGPVGTTTFSAIVSVVVASVAASTEMVEVGADVSFEVVDVTTALLSVSNLRQDWM